MKRIKSGIILLILLIVGFCVMSCDGMGGGNSVNENQTARELGCTDAQYQANIENSIVSLGNNYRSKKVLEKLSKGETVYVAAIGGSVTEGAGPKDSSGKELWELGYAFRFRDKLKEKYPDAKIQFDGAGLSGTPSALGVLRYEKDVVKVLGAAPDILIVEFSVNDGGECTKTRGFERIIRWALEQNENAVVIPLYADATYENTQDSMIPVADFYKLPQVSIKNANKKSGSGIDRSNGGKFFDDYVHPRKAGHEFMADCLMYVLEKQAAAEADAVFAIPAEYKNAKAFEDFHAVFANSSDSNVVVDSGSFSGKDGNSQSIKKGGTAFPENWYHTSGDSSLTFTLNCKSFVLAYKHQGNWLSPEFGKAEVYVDGVLKQTLDGETKDAAGKRTGWNDCATVMVFDDAAAADHKVEIKMADADKSKGFTVLAVGYSK